MSGQLVILVLNDEEEYGRATYEKEEEAKEEEEEDWTCEVGVVHDVLIYPSKRIEYSESLPNRHALVLFITNSCPAPLFSVASSLELAVFLWSCEESKYTHHTFVLICPKFTPSSSNNGGSPS